MTKILVSSGRFWGVVTTTVAGLLAACTGNIGSQDDKEGGLDGPGGRDPKAESAIVSGARRLTRNEYDATLADLLGDTTRSGFARLPEDAHDPFDNDYRTQRASTALVEAVEALAAEAAARAVQDPEVLARIVPCTPSGPGDTECLSTFVRTFGRRALRRPLTEDEVVGYVALSSFAVEKNDFNVAVELALSAFLQDPEFLYRIEIGTPTGVEGVVKLTDFEVATRLSYFLLGTTPDDALLDLAAAGALSDPAGVAAAAATLLETPRARERVEAFHAFWLGFHQLPHPAELSAEMRSETRALLGRVIFEKGADYFDLFRAEETFVSAALAQHYGLPAPSGGGGWVSYEGSGRRGILSHGSVLSVAGKFDDTSPTQRGIYVRKRLLCESIAPPPPTVNVDEPPEATNGGNCKIDRYAAHAGGTCAGCHSRLDPVGFGLERYDRQGRYREHDDGAPECVIDGEGVLEGLGTFSGPAELSDLLLDSGRLEACLVTQVYRFAMGRREEANDTPSIERLTQAFTDDGNSFTRLLLAVVSQESFGYRREEPASQP